MSIEYSAIQGNQRRLDACERHKFELPVEGVAFGQKLHCLNCNGMLNAIHAFYYTMGYESAGGNPNDVIENFREILPK